MSCQIASCLLLDVPFFHICVLELGHSAATAGLMHTDARPALRCTHGSVAVCAISTLYLRCMTHTVAYSCMTHIYALSVMLLATYVGAARLHVCSYLRHVPVQSRGSEVQSSMLLTCACMLDVPTQLHTTLRLSQARDMLCKCSRRTAGLRACMSLISSSHARMLMIDASDLCALAAGRQHAWTAWCVRERL
eukprot:5822040-Pleurochrysis_carterae.AAC.1